MSESDFTPIYVLINEADETVDSARAKVKEIVERIDRNELYWRDTMDRVKVANQETQVKLVREALDKFLSMRRSKDIVQDPQSLVLPNSEYWSLWSEFGQPHSLGHPLVCFGFEQEHCVGVDTESETSNHYKSEKLQFLNQAAHQFWAHQNENTRSTHPDNKDIVAWLVEHGYSETLAEKAAAIIRPEWAPVGRKPKE